MNHQINKYVDGVYEEVGSLRRKIHQHPEIGMEVYETVNTVHAALEEWGIPHTVLEGMGVIAEVKGTKEESDDIVMIRADMDALPVQEETGLPFASEVEGKMHACGHDLHTAMLLGTAKVLNEIKDQFAGTVRLLFQPAEEVSDGALFLIEHGALEGVQRGMGIHMEPLRPTGTISVVRGYDWAAVDHFYIDIEGVGAHGATPHDGKDATIAAASIALNLQTLVSREIDPMKSAVVTIGKLHSGTAFNIISHHAFLEGTCRCLDDGVYKMLPEAFERIVKNTAEAFGVTATLTYDRVAKPLKNDDGMVDLLERVCKEVIGEENYLQGSPAMIGEDFSEYAERIPCVFAHLGANGGYPLHHGKINFQEESMKTGILVEVEFALNALEDIQRK